MTSYDRHASHDSPYRTGQHMPLNQSRHAPLTSVATATSALDSRADLSSPYGDEVASPMSMGFRNELGSPTSPYSPGLRSSSILKSSSQDATEPMAPGEIQMQSFQEGLPPPPPVQHSWKRIDRWCEDHYTELWDQLSEGCTQNDINELEHELDCSLPMEVRESLQVHDGQERGGRPTGIIFGCMLLDCEENSQEYRNWRIVNEEYLQGSTQNNRSSKAFASSSSSAAAQGPNPFWRQELLDKQDSQPPKAIQKAYAHPGWIPLARDWGGNNLAVDLAPGPAGKWGQIIIFGRDYDCKYVVARSWAAFLAMVADDMSSEKVFVDEDSQELKLREFKAQSVEPPYLDILRWRMDQKYGRRIAKKKAPNGVSSGSRKGSPYGSPTEERGRSPNRFPNRGPSTQSPRATAVGIPSPLSQVSDETVRPMQLQVDTGSGNKNLKVEKLIEAPTPTMPVDGGKETNLADTLTAKAEQEESKEKPATGLVVEGLDEMKNVAI